MNKKQAGFSLQNSFPNPFINELNVQLLSDKTQPVQLQLMDMSGRVVYSRNAVCNNGINNILLDQFSGLKSGVYLLRVNTDENRLQQKLVKVQ